MSDILLQELHRTLRTVILAAAAVGGFFILAHRIFPPSAPTHGPVSVVTPSPIEREAQAIVNAVALNAVRNAGVSPLVQPAVTIVEKSGLVGGLAGAQVAQILGALKAKTAERVAVGSKLVGPSPAPRPSAVPGLTQAQLDAIGAADRVALAEVLADPATKIATSVTISRQEVEPSRVGSLISAYGSGLSYAVYRHKQYEIDIAGVLRDAHIAPAGCAVYNIPHTQLGVGPCVFYDHKINAGIGASIHF